MKTEASSTTSQSSAKSQFREKTESLLAKLEALHEGIEVDKLTKLKKFLSDISNVETQVDSSISQKRNLYESLLQKVNRLGAQIEEQGNATAKNELLIQHKLQSLHKMNEKAFQKLKKERLATEQRLHIHLQSKLDALQKKYRKSSSIVSKNRQSEIPSAEYRGEVQAIQEQVSQFFKESQVQEEKAKFQIFNTIEEASNLLRSETLDKTEVEAMEYMRLIHLEVMSRVNLLQQNRTKIEEEVLGLLEKVDSVTAECAGSTLA